MWQIILGWWEQSLETLTPAKKTSCFWAGDYRFLSFFALFRSWSVALVPVCIMMVFIDLLQVGHFVDRVSTDIDRPEKGYIFAEWSCETMLLTNQPG